CLARGGGGNIAGDDELLPGGAFRLHPAPAASLAVRCIAQFGDDAFEAEAAGVAQDHGAVLLEMPAVADEADMIRDELFEHALALDERQAGEIVAVEVHQVENIEREPIVAAL